jgi:hypothetical protein
MMVLQRNIARLGISHEIPRLDFETRLDARLHNQKETMIIEWQVQ